MGSAKEWLRFELVFKHIVVMIVAVVAPVEEILRNFLSRLELLMIEIVEWVIWLFEYHIPVLEGLYDGIVLQADDGFLERMLLARQFLYNLSHTRANSLIIFTY